MTYDQSPSEIQIRKNRGVPGSAWGGEALYYEEVFIYFIKTTQGGVCSVIEQVHTS